ncbi:hypothetical protein AYJ54_17745 [Bradyrhizobium centrolobii]|uniref:Uncharacterized protein n=2 Tax=Bradyrhizobium TaxID=374 RepID=A0A176ZHU2_9BRAD|nr:hypothetical protein AYJ54_17745 [Bradyrhizobium centrolobii]OAF19724.1 hypothetical protein AXW67_35820 [Bradyrhizobium neotropicale]
MAVEREARQHFHPVDGRDLGPMNGRGVAVIDVGVEPLIDLDPLALPASPISAMKRLSLASTTLPIMPRASSRSAGARSDRRRQSGARRPRSGTHVLPEEAALDQLAARQIVEGAHIGAQMCEDQRGLRRIIIAVSVRDQVVDRLGLELGAENAAVGAIGREASAMHPRARSSEASRIHCACWR